MTPDSRGGPGAWQTCSHALEAESNSTVALRPWGALLLLAAPRVGPLWALPTAEWPPKGTAASGGSW